MRIPGPTIRRGRDVAGAVARRPPTDGELGLCDAVPLPRAALLRPAAARANAGGMRRTDPDAREVGGPAADPWMAAMRRGDFEHAWQVSDRILRARIAAGVTCWHWPRHLQYVWGGEPLAGKRVLVRCYHGLGDTLQFIRFVAPLRALATHVTIWVQPALLPLVATAPGVDAVLPLHDGTPEVAHDVDIEIMELPHALRITAATLPNAVPYLFPPKAAAAIPETGARRVGIVWKAGGWDPARSVPAALLGQLTAIADTRFYSLQLGAETRELACLGLTDISTDDVIEAAARIRQLDCVITVDTMTAHLAGALAAPTWVLLQQDCDWRWMSGRGDSPWYPTARLFRQRRQGDWLAVIADVAAALRAC